MLDGVRVSKYEENVRISFSLADTDIERYWTPSSQSFRSVPLVPNVKCVVPPTTLALWMDSGHYCSAVRIGSQLFQTQPASTSMSDSTFSRIDSKPLGDSWEDIVALGPYLVVCRRQVPRPEPPADKEKESRRVQSMQAKMSNREMKERLKAQQTRKRIVKLDVEDVRNILRNYIKTRGERSYSRDSRDSSSDPSESESSESESSDSLDQSSSDASSSDNEMDGVPSAEESWSEGSTAAEDDSTESSIPSHDPSDNDESPDLLSGGLDGSELAEDDSDKDESDAESASSFDSYQDGSESDSVESISSLVSLSNVVDAMEGSDADDEYHESEFEDDEFLNQVLVQQAAPAHEVGIKLNHGGRVQCDSCGAKSLPQYYRCIKCNEDAGYFDLCRRCERRGRWCLNKGHQLFRIVRSSTGQNTVGVKVRRNFCLRQEIMVFKNSEGEANGRTLFRMRKNHSSLLYQSPPVIHPQHHLVVWPLTGGILLFADFQTNKFFEQRINATGTSRKRKSHSVPTHQRIFLLCSSLPFPQHSGTNIATSNANAKSAYEICVSLSFSPCGQHLRVATIEAEVERIPDTQCYPSQGQAAGKRRLCLNLQVTVLRLSPSRPTRNPPKMLYSTGFRMGPCSNPIVQQLPFTFTWCATELFVTLSDLSLRVYRIHLPGGEMPVDGTTKAQAAPAPGIGPDVPTPCTLKKKIYLPRSSKHRSVQYFPPHAPGGNATVIIGPRYGRFPAPAIGVYLSPEDLGEWVAVLNGERGNGAGACVPERALQGQLEDWDGEQDCDIIPFEC